MPTCDNKSKLTTLGSLSAAELDHHDSEAAKVKRTKEQAYFNSYDFDAIEVLPYDEDEEQCPKQCHHYPQYSVGGCKVCHHLSQSSSHSASSSSSTPGITHQPSSGVSHTLKIPPHNHQSHQHQQLKSKKKKESISSHSSSTSSSSFSHPISNPSDGKRTYLKRIGAFLTSHSMGKRSSIEALADIEKQAKCSSSSSSNQVSLNNRSAVAKLFEGRSIAGDDVADGGGGGVAASGSIKRDHVIDETGNGNFLLPRAMLKYQSVGFNNSMPLAVISNLGGSSTSLMGSSISGQQLNQVTNSSIKSKSKAIPVESPISATDTAVSINNNKQKPHQVNLISSKSASVENSGFVSSSSSASASNSSLAKCTLNTSSLSAAETAIIIGETSANVDVSGVLPALALVGGALAVASKSITNPNVVSSITSDLQQSSYNEKLVSSSSSSSTSANAAIIGVGTPNGSSRSITTKTNGGSGDAAISAGHSSSGRGARERTSSQSHYSTDKSGSSGYYSSNVCSTYSVEDHIYCEPTIDILEVNKPAILKPSKLGHPSSHSHRQIMIVHNSDDEDEDHHVHRGHLKHQEHQRQQNNMKQKLHILETSIENLDRHLKSYPKLSNHDRLALFVRPNPQAVPPHLFQVHNGNSNNSEAAKNRYGHLPTIMEGGANDLPTRLQNSWQDEIAEDSLLDIDLDAFLMTSEGKTKGPTVNGIDNPTFDKSVILHDEDMENHYKCAKYINSCPEDAYRLESEVGNSLDHFLKKYDDQIHFQNTRELLEDVRDKIRLLSESAEGTNTTRTAAGDNDKKHLPHELDTMIKALKGELESYLERMNHHSEMEIRQLCTGLVKNQNIVRMKKAFERRKSNASDSEYDFAYEAIRDGTVITVQHTQQHMETTTSIRCSSDPNFKMKRKSLCDVFPKMDAECYVGTSTMAARATVAAASGSGVNGGPSFSGQLSSVLNDNNLPLSVMERTQLQRNLSFHKPVLNQLDGEGNEDGDKDSIVDWHQNKPSNWEMYYGTNRLNQTLLGKRGVITNGNQAIMSYPSSRPESDFTLDLPRAEQLRIKMEKEKKFRRRCRYLTTFLSLVFFLLTVMVVSLVLTRGKRMFGSMI